MKDYKNSKFKKRLRISEENHEFIGANKAPYKTMAGFGDKIINQYRRQYLKKKEIKKISNES